MLQHEREADLMAMSEDSSGPVLFTAYRGSPPYGRCARARRPN